MNRYNVTREGDEMIVIPDRKGNYRATTPEEIKRALSEPRYQTTTAEVLIGNRWCPLRRGGKARISRQQKDKRPYSNPKPIKPPPLYLRILRVLHLYKDPLDILIYHGK